MVRVMKCDESVSRFDRRARELIRALASVEEVDARAQLVEELEGIVEAEPGELWCSVGDTGEALVAWHARTSGQHGGAVAGDGFVIVGDVFDASDEAAVNALLDTGRAALVAVSSAGVRFLWRPGVKVGQAPVSVEEVQP